MSKTILAVGAGALVTLASLIAVQQRNLGELRREVAALRDDVRIAAQQRATAEARRAVVQAAGVREAGAAATPGPVETGEVAKLRQDVDGLKKTAQEFAKVVAAAQAKAALEAVPTKLLPVAEMKNGGRATPGAALETALWAASGGDVALLAQSLGFTATAKAKADAWFAGLSDATRAQYGSAEQVVALMIARDAATLTGMQVLGQKEISPQETVLAVRLGSDDGKTKDDKFLLQRAADGWKLVLPDPVLERYAKQLAQSIKPGGK